MKINIQILPLLLAFALLSACHHKHYTPGEFPDEQLRFGSGGGFSGAVTEYILLENGQLFRMDSMKKDTTEIAKLPKKEAKSLLEEAEELNLEKMTIEEPGNMYYFIGMKKKEEMHKVTWGKPDYTIDAKIESFYKKLIETTKKADKPIM